MTATDAKAARQAVRAILNRLEDPFDTVFPLQQIMGDLDRGIQQAEASIAYKYCTGFPAWSEVEVEHHREVIAYNRGAALVLCQVLLTQVVADVSRLQLQSFSRKKLDILRLENRMLADGLSEVATIDALANYFKHYREWSPNWEAEEFDPKDTARFTKRDVKCLGINSQNKGDVGPVFDCLGAETCEDLLEIVIRWRERLHSYLTKLVLSSRELVEVAE